MFNVFIETRFNLPFPFSKGINLTQDWLQYRFLLFKKYCLNSVINQTFKDFNWIIYFDKNTDTSLLNEIKSFDSRIVICHSKNDYLSIKKEKSNYLKRFILSRLDSDDSYHKDFLKNVCKKSCSSKTDLVIDIKYHCFLNNKNIYYSINSSSSSHFASLLTNNANLSIYDFYHGDLSKKFKKEFIDKYLAVEVIHDSNLKNRFYLQHKRKSANKDFFENYNICL